MNDAAIESGKASAPTQQSHRLGARVLSLDQFRGYTILGMILVNFIGYYEVIHPIFMHNDDYFSYADSIMPAFHLAVGFSFRLTMLQRLATATVSIWVIWLVYVRRSLSLVFIGVLFFGLGGNFEYWDQFASFPSDSQGISSEPAEKTDNPGIIEADSGSDSNELDSVYSHSLELTENPTLSTFSAQWGHWLAVTLKSRMWNTLAIIGVTQIVILPVVASSYRVRVLAMIVLALGHALITYWFNWGFVVGEPDNWMVKLWGTGDVLSWDGGFFGPLCWAVVMLSGTLAHDIVVGNCSRNASRKLLIGGATLMLVAWGLSCLSRLYDLDKSAIRAKHCPENAIDPVLPISIDISGQPFSSFLAEPPFVDPPRNEAGPTRLRNYWMMIKQIPTMTFMLCATGFAWFVYGFFVWLCDVRGWSSTLLNTFGTNALAAYVLHSFIGDQIDKLVPSDAPLWYVLGGLIAFFLCTWSMVRFLEKQRIFIRL